MAAFFGPVVVLAAVEAAFYRLHLGYSPTMVLWALAVYFGGFLLILRADIARKEKMILVVFYALFEAAAMFVVLQLYMGA